MTRTVVILFLVACFVQGSCARAPETRHARNLLLITIDTLRADRVGAYGYSRARTPRLDALARNGALFERAFTAAPITLPSHATLLTGRYPPGHGSRDNGMRVNPATPTLATELKARGFRTAAFVAAFPLDHQFGLARGFEVYGDRLPRDAAGRLANERPASQVVDEAIAWLRATNASQAADSRFFAWVHLFEPHAPYEGDLSRPVADRYDDEVATADREIGRLIDALGPALSDTLIVAAGDHGEAFGEHGEYAHSIFVYDTTLRVPLLLSGPGVAVSRIAAPVTLADVAPTAMKMLGLAIDNVDGVDLSSLVQGQSTSLPDRELYAESFAPLIEFGWAPLRAVRSGQWKYIAAPKPELYDVDNDTAERTNVEALKQDVARRLDARVSRYSSDSLQASTGIQGDAAERLRALGYAAGSIHNPQSQSAIRDPQSAIRSDPKDRRELAARLAQVTSGELAGPALVSALEAIVREDPRNGQAHLRLGYARAQSGDCTRAEPEFQAALAAGLVSADVYLGLAGCLTRRRDFKGAEAALNEAARLDPDNPVVLANIGIVKGNAGNTTAAIDAFQAAVNRDPDFHEARFNLALTYARAGRMTEAAASARELLARLPANAPQRAEVQRLLTAIEQQQSK